MAQRIIINGGRVATMDPQRSTYAVGHVLIEDGTVVEVGLGLHPVERDSTEVSAEGALVLPGFVNTHHHLSTRLLWGVNSEIRLNVDYAAPSMRARLYEAQDDAECYSGAMLAICELIRSGVTTTADSQSMWRGMHRADGSLRALHDSGMRALFSTAYVDRTEIVPRHRQYPVSEAVAEFERLRNKYSHGLVRVIPEALSLPRASEALITSLLEAGNGALAMHMSYTQDFVTWALTELGCEPVAYLAGNGMLSSSFLGAHPIFMSDDEVSLYAEHGATASYCAVGNMSMGAPHLDLGRLLRAGIPTGLGLDSHHGNNFFENMKLSVSAQRQLHGDGALGESSDALAWATTAGAEALGMSQVVGSIEVGKRADLQILDGGAPELGPTAGVLRLSVLGVGPEAVRDVMVDGEWLMRNRKMTRLPLQEVVDDAEIAQARVMERAGLVPPAQIPAGFAWLT